jgi:pimeloyl-ACP methyl ester carboxylesterase
MPRAAVAPLIRGYFRVAAAIAPQRVDQHVVRLFATPRRTRPRTGSRTGEPWWITSGNERIAVYCHGFGPTILLSHGWAGDAFDMIAIATELRSRGFRIVTFDMPAHGRSSGRQTTLPAMARAAQDVAHAVGPITAVIGHSLGATAALLALRDGLDARCAVTIAPPREAPHFLAQLVTALGLPSERLQGAIRVVERQVGSLAQYEGDRAARALRIPGLVIHDRADRQVPFAHGEAIARSWNAELFTTDGMGHRRILENPEVIDRIATFVTGRLA